MISSCQFAVIKIFHKSKNYNMKNLINFRLHLSVTPKANHFTITNNYQNSLIMLRKSYIVTFALLTLFLISSCVVSKKDSKDTQEGLATLGQIDASNTVLLIEKLTSGMYHGLYNNRRMGDCKQFYKGQVEAAVFKEVDKDPKYQDKNIYRFMLVDGSESHEWITTYSNGATSTNTHTITNYFVLDRLTGKQFDLNVAGVNPDRVFKKAVKKLNKYMMSK